MMEVCRMLLPWRKVSELEEGRAEGATGGMRLWIYLSGSGIRDSIDRLIR